MTAAVGVIYSLARVLRGKCSRRAVTREANSRADNNQFFPSVLWQDVGPDLI